MDIQTPSQPAKKSYIGVIVLVIVVALLAYYFGTSRGALQVAEPGQNVGTGAILPPSGGTYDYVDAPNHIGEYASIRGTIARVYTSSKGTTFLDYCVDYKSCPFSAVIFASDRAKFSNPAQYQGQTITIKGLIKTYRGRAEIILNGPDQISG